LGPRPFIAAALVSIAGFGCSSGGSSPNPECLAIAQQYVAAFADAQLCDPADPSSCSGGRPVGVYEQLPDGGVVLQGLCNCLNHVNPSRTATLDALLAEFTAKGCSIGNCPCPQVPAQTCHATDAGTATCAPSQ
jgi:hypothetical protein